MKKTVLMTMALLLCAVWAVAQSNSQDSTNQGSSPKASETTIQGCLSGSNGSFTLIDATGVQYQLQGDSAKLSPNVDKEVRVSGSMASAASTTDSADTSSTSTATSSPSAPPTFNVTSIKKVANTCKAGK